MNRVTRFTVALGAAAVLALAATLGFLIGLAGQRAGSAAHDEAQELPGALEARDPALALRSLDAYGHWGRYVAPQSQPAEPALLHAARPTAPIGSLARAYRLVGIERRGGKRIAVLLPAGAEGAEEIRLGQGEVLAEDISVSEIGVDSVRFATAEGESILYLYGSEP